MGRVISNTLKTIWVPGSISAAIVSVVLGFWIGPSGIYAASILGFFCAFIALMQRLKQNAYIAGRGVPVLLLAFHTLLLITGFTLASLFLEPLSDDLLQIPRLNQIYSPADSVFEIRAPEGWQAEDIHMGTDSGVRFRPLDRTQYMGISELTVRVRKIPTPKVKRAAYLQSMAEMVSTNREKTSKLFNFSTEPARLLNGDDGLWSRLVVRRFWVPLYQLSLFGIKRQNYLCSVSAVGLKSHSTLYEVMCLGIYETIRIKPPEK